MNKALLRGRLEGYKETLKVFKCDNKRLNKFLSKTEKECEILERKNFRRARIIRDLIKIIKEKSK